MRWKPVRSAGTLSTSAVRVIACFAAAMSGYAMSACSRSTAPNCPRFDTTVTKQTIVNQTGDSVGTATVVQVKFIPCTHLHDQ